MKVNTLSFYVKEQQITNHKGQSLFRKTSILSELENVVSLDWWGLYKKVWGSVRGF